MYDLKKLVWKLTMVLVAGVISAQSGDHAGAGSCVKPNERGEHSPVISEDSVRPKVGEN
jgi:hypothetical protein